MSKRRRRRKIENIVDQNEAEARALGYPNQITLQCEQAAELYPEIMFGKRPDDMSVH